MIPKNIQRNDALYAIDKIDKFGVPAKRESTKYSLYYKGKAYPPKYVLSLANIAANGFELDPGQFTGGNVANRYLKKLQFEIIPESSRTFGRREQIQGKREVHVDPWNPNRTIEVFGIWE